WSSKLHHKEYVVVARLHAKVSSSLYKNDRLPSTNLGHNHNKYNQRTFWCNSHLKIILLGGRNSGKSSVGNLLLGKDEFLTKERTICSRRVGMVAGQWLTVVDTPGWWCDFSTQDTCELVKRELVNSVSLCSPGPHVFLIIVKLSSAFSERRRRAVEEHVALLGDGVWSHSILVLTGTDRFKHSEEEQVLIAGKALHWLRERCNHRTHRFNLSVGTDVSKLLEKIQRIVRENGHGVFEVFLKQGSGKTSVMNTILSRETQPTKKTIQCVTGKAMVFGEMVLSLSLCPPGPHVFLLVIRADRAFTETYRRAAQDHLELISEHIWSRVILVFSVGDWLEGTSLEQYIESEGEPLQWLVERCGNRYHVLNCRARGDGFQVREMKEKQRQMAKSQLEKLGPLQELRLVLIGGRKTGKSSCGNTILGRECFNTDTHTASCAVIQHKIKDKVVTVVDTPGGSSVSPNLVTEPPTCAVLLVVNLSSSFKNTQKEELEEQLEEGGGHLWHKAVVLFSYGDWLGDTSIEQRIESEGEPLQRLVEKCGNRYQVLDNRNTENGDQVDDLIQLIEEMTTDERVEALHRTDHMWSSVPATHEQEEDAGAIKSG
uniref:Si:ch211-214j24.15 n=1 Tax=Cynoglossus semilaevis TaxID=244447 RepID=A0A3P8X1L4_CYNSE